MEEEYTLPAEVWAHVFHYLQRWEDVLRVAQVCSCFRTLAHDALAQRREHVRADMLVYLSISPTLPLSDSSVWAHWHSVLQWTRQEILHDNCRVLGRQEEQGHTKVCEWLYQTFQLGQESKQIMVLADMFLAGNLSACMWHCKTFGITKKDLWKHFGLLFTKALRGGGSQQWNWLKETYSIGKTDLLATQKDSSRSRLYHFLSLCARDRKKGCLDWLWHTFQLQPQDVGECDCQNLLEKALMYDNVTFCEWLCCVCCLELSRADIRLVLFPLNSARPSLLQRVLSKRKLETCQWLCTKLECSPEERARYRFLSKAVLSGNKELCVWMYETFHPSSKEASSALITAATCGHLHLCIWLHSLYSFTVEEASEALYFALLEEHGSVCQWIHNQYHPDMARFWLMATPRWTVAQVCRMKQAYRLIMASTINK